MIRAEEKIKIEEFNKRPNLHTSKSMLIYAIVLLVIWILAEISVFKINPLVSRICGGVCIPLLVVPYFLNRYTKVGNYTVMNYLSMGCILVVTFMVIFMYTFHGILALTLPLLISTQYKSRNITLYATIGTVVIALITPIVSYMASTWDMVYLSSLISSGEHVADYVIYTPNPVYIKKIILYMSLPQAGIVIAFSSSAFAITNNSIKTVDMEIEKQIASEQDGLTGLYNQNSYKQLLEQSVLESGNIGVLFFDINGLKKANDTYGHEYGDLLISRCAKSVLNVCNKYCSAYRIGGDEFVLFYETNDSIDIIRKKQEWENALILINMENQKQYGGLQCSISVGTAYGPYRNLAELVRQADMAMYEQKNKYKEQKNK